MKKLLLISVLCGMISVVGAQTNVSGTITIDSTFSLSESPYNVTSNMIVSKGVTLTVDSGVVVKFYDGTSLDMKGTLNATNAIFTSINTVAVKGAWDGIIAGYNADTAKIFLNNCSVSYATEIYLVGGTANIHNCSIQNCENYGLLVDEAVDLNLTSTTISDNHIPVQFNGMPHLIIDQLNDFQGNDIDKLKIDVNSISTSSTLPFINIPYNVTSSFTVNRGVTLTVDSGVVVEFDDETKLEVLGHLIANKAKFTSVNAPVAAKGDWNGIRVGYNCDTALINLNECSVSFATEIYLVEGTANINNCAIQNGENYGLLVDGGVDLNLTSTTISDNHIPVQFNGWPNMTIDGLNDFQGNDIDKLMIQSNAKTSTNCTLPSLNVPYQVIASVTVATNVTLTVNSGVLMEFNDATGLLVRGTLVANNVTFTSVNAEAQRGDWNGIQIGNTYGGGVMNMSDCSILFAKKNYMYSGVASIDNTTIQNASETGLYVEGTFTLDLTSSTISASALPMKLNNFPALTTNTVNDFEGNDIDRVEIYGSTLNHDCNLPFVNVPYYFISNLTVNNNATLTVDRDNILLVNNIQVDAGASLVVLSNTIFKTLSISYGIYVNGTMTAEADPTEFIYFTSGKDDNWGGDTNNDAGATDPASENWGGIRLIGTGSNASSLVRCKVRFAGYNDRGGISLTNSSPTIDSCDITTNYYGIYIAEASNPTISNTTIGSSDMTPIAMSFEANPVFSYNILSFSDNEYDAIGLLGGTMTTDGHIIKRNFTGIDNITYFLLDKVIVPETKTLTIDPGIVIKADAHYTSRNRNIVVEGTLIANGTEAENIIFTSAKDDNHGNPGDTNKDGTTETPAIGDFGAIVFAPSSSSSSSLTYSNVKYAKGYRYEEYLDQYVTDAAVITVNSSPTISHNLIKDVTQGIRCYEASQPTISNNSVVNASSTPFAISGSATPTFSDNTFTNAGVLALGLIGGNMSQDGTLSKVNLGGYDNIAYSLLYHLTIKDGTTFNIDPGVVIKVDNSQIIVEGGLMVNGTSSEKVIFTSIKDDNVGNPADANGDGNASSPAAGDWTRIRFEDSSNDDSCRIDNAEMRYAGKYFTGYSNYYYSTVETSNANPTISNSSIGQGYHYGVRMEGNSAPLLQDVSIQNMQYEPIGMSLTSNPTLTDLTFVANRSKGLAIIDKELSSDATLIRRDVAGVDNIAYVINELLTVKPDARFTINPGVNIKFKDYNSYIKVEGALIADGTPDETIVFTSIKDDSRGGDTNNDGNTAPPALGDWRGLYFLSSGLDSLNLLDNVSVRYGGYGSRIGESVSFDACSGTVSNSSIELSKNYGLEIIGSADPVISNTSFYNIEKAPIYMSMFANPTFENNSMSNVGRQSIQLIPEIYSKTDTFEFRKFAGIDSITYTMIGNYTINDGTVITIPAGMVFKSTDEVYWSYTYCYYGASFVVNGQLQVEGESTNPAVFTSFYDDTQGRPLDTGSDGQKAHVNDNAPWFVFENVSDDVSRIDNAIIKYGKRGIDIKSASPTITNSVFEKCERGILMTGVSEPVINDNVFNDLDYSPMSISLVAFPSSAENNLITGSTYKVIEVNEETLTQDVTLPRRSFGGVPKIPYYFHGDYTVGTGAILTIDSGVVCKFNYQSQLTVEKGLIGKGAVEKENNIVFTHITDDFYGGDSNSDSTSTGYNTSSSNSWYGIKFVSTAINSSCILDHCVFRNIYSSTNYSAIEANSASPTIVNSYFSNVPNGVNVKGSANPIINNCDFYDIKYKGINNEDMSFTIDARNNWWGSNTGPTHEDNSTGMGVAVTDKVNYTPWKELGANHPILGDVSLNGEVQAYDAALILKSTVNTYTLTSDQEDVADVSGDRTVSAFDASMVLRYSVGLINFFETTTLRSSKVSNTQLHIDDVTAESREEVEIPITLENGDGTYAMQIKAHYDVQLLQQMKVVPTQVVDGMSFTSNVKDGYIYISMAGIHQMTEGGVIANLTFTVADTDDEKSSAINVLSFMKNEDDLTPSAKSGVVVVKMPTDLVQKSDFVTSIKAYPNPFDRELNIKFNVVNTSFVSVKVYNQYGQLINTLTEGQLSSGQYDMIWDGTSGMSNGMYFIKFVADDKEQVLKVQMY